MLGDSLRRRHGAEKESRPESTKRPPGRRAGGRFWLPWWQWLLAGVVVLAVSFGVGYLLSTQLLFPPPDTAGTGIPVPSLYGQTRGEAEAALRETGLGPGEVVELASLATRRGRVLAQDPIPGQQLRRGATVSFAVSGGPPEVRVPPVQGMSPGSARALLEDIGFDVEVRQVRAEGVTGEIVAGAEPATGMARTLPATVTLLVNEGSPDRIEGRPAEDTSPEGATPEGAPMGGRP